MDREAIHEGYPFQRTTDGDFHDSQNPGPFILDVAEDRMWCLLTTLTLAARSLML